MAQHSFVPGIQPPDSTSADAIYFVVGAHGVWVKVDEGATRLPRASEVSAVGLDPRAGHYLGRLDGEDAFAIGHGGAPPEGTIERGLRSLYGHLDETAFAVAGRAVQIVDWDRTHRHCGRCATATTLMTEERVRVCPSCGLRVFPRLAPAVIVLVHKGDRVLLARAANFPAAFYSTLAGFVEPGESLEDTIVREIREEVGIEVTRLRYFGSQPWPFPHSLMIGFDADWAGGEIHIDAKEIIDADWFDAGALPMIPPGLSIARRLIDAWLAGQRG